MVNNTNKVNSSVDAPSGNDLSGSNGSACLTSKLTHEVSVTEGASAQSVTDTGVGCSALLGSVFSSSEFVSTSIFWEKRIIDGVEQMAPSEVASNWLKGEPQIRPSKYLKTGETYFQTGSRVDSVNRNSTPVSNNALPELNRKYVTDKKNEEPKEYILNEWQ